MIYRKFKDFDISALAFGCMRFPTFDGNDANINEQEAEKLVDEAYKAGVNYFDTAWGYHMGNSETFIGKTLAKYPRESFYLATKFPGYDISNFGKVEEIFEKQLEKCQTDYFDFYLLHNVNELNINQYLDDCQYMTVTYLLEQVKKGRIKHLGFSAHGSVEVMKQFVDKYGKYMEFGMVQLNYLDYNFQNCKAKIDLLKENNIPIWVMEPLRGGMLAKMTPENQAKMDAITPGVTPVEWAFRYLESIPEVVTILSGMSDMEQVKEKLKIFEKDAPATGLEVQTLINIANDMLKANIIPCTACRYCLEHCPKQLDIPSLISSYNEEKFTGGGFIAPMVIQALPVEKRPSACIGCKKCEKVCPQQIKISEVMKDFDVRTKPTREAFFGKE